MHPAMDWVVNILIVAAAGALVVLVGIKLLL
jgi:hypothetical protein